MSTTPTRETGVDGAAERIVAEASSWPGVEAGPGRRGELAIRFGRREIGHLHGDRSAHFSFPKDVWRHLRGEGRITPHPVFPDREGPAARRIGDEDDVRDVIALLRLNYDRAAARPAPAGFDGLEPSAPLALDFAPSLHVRAFRLRRGGRGDVVVYATRAFRPAGVARQYLNHWHEAMVAGEDAGAPLFVHQADRAEVERRDVAVRATFSRRHTLDDDFEAIPTPGHTPGATAYLWAGGGHRFLFTGDSIYLDGDEWVAAVLGSSDRDAYLESLALLRELDFDVLVPWAASAGRPWFARTDAADTRRRIDAIIARVRAGGDR